MFCVVEQDLASHSRAYDRSASLAYDMGMSAQNDECSLYRDDALEFIDASLLSPADSAVLIDCGLYVLLSSEGKTAIDDKAFEIAEKDSFKRYK